MENRLEHLSQFRQILKTYTISEHSKQILRDTKLVLLVAPTSAGRNTIIRELLKTGNYHFIISDTTRKPRVNDGVLEQNGIEYWFRKEEDTLDDLKNGKFLEAEIVHNQQVSGISIRELERANNTHKTAITDIDILGTQNIVQAKPDALPILVIPPSFDEWQRRIKNRGAMSDEEYIRRLKTASKIFKTVLEHPYFKFVLNDEILNAASQIEDLVENNIDEENQQNCHRLVKELLDQTQAFLKDK
jgi:guanylate kinase